jgi:hypothetical protein
MSALGLVPERDSRLDARCPLDLLQSYGPPSDTLRRSQAFA